VSHDFCGQAAVIFEAGGHVSDVVLGFDDRFTGVARFEIGQTGSVQADFLGQLEENAAAILRRGFCPRAKSKASRADFTAASTSVLSAALTRAITSSVEGS